MSPDELLGRLQSLSDDANEAVWVEEAEGCDRAWEARPTIGVPASNVFREARARLCDRGEEP